VPAAVEGDPGASVSAEESSEVPAAVADVSPSEPVVAVGEVTGELPIVTDSGADA
jgi:hypothetical protein